MKRPLLKIAIIASVSCLIAAGPGPGKVLAKKGSFVFKQSDLNLYFDILRFMIEKPLDDKEQNQVKTEVLAAFEDYPAQIEAECFSLQETLDFLNNKPGADKEEEVKEILFETLIEYAQKGNRSAFVEIARIHRPDKF